MITQADVCIVTWRRAVTLTVSSKDGAVKLVNRRAYIRFSGDNVRARSRNREYPHITRVARTLFERSPRNAEMEPDQSKWPGTRMLLTQT